MISTIVAAILSGGIASSVTAVVQSRSIAAKTKAEAERIGATTEVEVDSVAMVTMERSLRSAQGQIEILTKQRDTDRTYYLGRIDELENRVDHLRAEVEAAEGRLRKVLRATEQTSQEIRDLREGDRYRE